MSVFLENFLLLRIGKLVCCAGLIFVLFSMGRIFEAVERYARNIFEDRIPKKVLYVIFVMTTMCFEGASLWLLSIFYHWELLTTLFAGSFVLVIVTWNTIYFRNASHNQARAVSRFIGGTEEHTEFCATEMSTHPFVIGTYLFGSISIVGSFLYCLPYLV